MTLHLYDTLTRTKLPVRSPEPGKPITLYLCGPTVYSRAHIGNARGPVVFDVLYRLLRHLHGAENVRYARNITDIDDKIMDKAVSENRSPQAVAREYEAHYHADMAALGCLPPDFSPRATDHIEGPHGMIAMIAALIARGVAYVAEGHVLFEVGKFAGYGKLSKRPMDEMIAGARVEVAPYKRSPGDFVLWKPSRDDQPGWDSEWGRGRPGWHIECSAMIRSVLETDTIDIHGGGIDLVFPHHENERAQSCCANAAELSRIWMHNGFLQMGETKMSKSIGNIVTPRELLDAGWQGEVIRLALLRAHYRQPLTWTDELLVDSKARLDKIYRFSGSEPAASKDAFLVSNALSDDLNAIEAINALSRLRDEIPESGQTLHAQGRLRSNAALLGLLACSHDAWFRGASSGLHSLDPDSIEWKVAERTAAKAAKNWPLADAIRNDLLAVGITLEDAKDGSTSWRRT